MLEEKSTELAKAESVTLAEEAVKILLEKLAIDVSMFNVREHTSVTDSAFASSVLFSSNI